MKLIPSLPMRRVRLLTILFLFAAAPVAEAQSSRFFRSVGLTPDEMALASNAAESLFTRSDVRAGMRAAWNSETSEATGEVEVLAVTEGGRCVAFVHRVRANPNARTQPLELRRCRTADGQWVLSP